jgi:membrane protein DedA with SNARE-associated domain
MADEIILYITKYGYLAIFILVFLQETGMPNPFPNELLLIFSGYLSFRGILFLPFVVLTAICADLIGTGILYFLFYSTGTLIIQKKPKWLPISSKMIEQLSIKISKGGMLGIFIFRLTPFTRGYASVITGLLQVKPRVFLPVALLSAVTWATGYVLIGHLIGPSWNYFIESIGSFKYIMLALLALILGMVLLIYYNSKRENPKAETGIKNSLTI